MNKIDIAMLCFTVGVALTACTQSQPQQRYGYFTYCQSYTSQQGTMQDPAYAIALNHNGALLDPAWVIAMEK